MITQETSTAETPVPVQRHPRRRWLRLFLLLVVPSAAILLGASLYFGGGRYASTENAYVKAHKIAISSDLDGRVVVMEVSDNERVRQGQVLFRLDDEPLQIQLSARRAELELVRADIEALRASYRQEQAELQLAEEKLTYTQREHKRQQQLSQSGVVSASNFDQTDQAMRVAQRQVIALREGMNQTLVRLVGDPTITVERHPRYRQTEASLRQTELDLRRIVVRAPTSGIISRLSLEPGEYVEAGQPVFSLIATQSLWVNANFKETQLAHIQTGQTATVRADTYPDLVWQAEVSSISAATGAEFALLPPQNASGNWVKVVQRIPVHLRLLEAHTEAELRAGMSVEVAIDTGYQRPWPAPLAALRRGLSEWLRFGGAASVQATVTAVPPMPSN